MKPLPRSFYLREDVVQISKELLGKLLFSFKEGVLTGGRIIETEAYRGPEDKASHAYRNRRTKRTEVMFNNGGICYLYRCYGIHTLLNVITNSENIPHAVLIRAIEPLVGIETMCLRRKKRATDQLATGPGNVTQALGLSIADNGSDLTTAPLWIEEDHENSPTSYAIWSGPRVGIDYAEEDALLPWRFKLIKIPSRGIESL